METVKKNRRTKKSERSPRKIRQQERKEHGGSLPEIRARLNHLRMAPRKACLVADLIRGRGVEEAQQMLEFSQRMVAKPILQLLKSAVANARNENEQRDESALYIHSIWVDRGRSLHRFHPRAMGRAARLQKRMCHITIVLKEKE